MTPHYAWVVAGTTTFVVFAGVGLARFSYGMILPDMAEDLALSYRQQGLLGASYFVGYLAIVAVMPWLAPKLGSRVLCVLGLAVVALGLVSMSLFEEYAPLSIAYFVVGLGSGGAFIGAMALPAQWFHPSHRGRAAGVATGGAGIAILVSGLAVPLVTAVENLTAWQAIWLSFGIVTLLASIVSHLLIRNHPTELGLTPYGGPVSDGAFGQTPRSDLRGAWAFLLHLGLVYLIFAAAALTYTTFIVTTMVDQFGISENEAGWLWAVIGALSIFSGALFGSVSDRFGHRIGMTSALLVQATAYAAAAIGSGMMILSLSVVLFGISAWSMPSIVAAAAGDYLGPGAAAAGFAILTLMFAAGQVAGPASAGLVADYTGDFAACYGLNAGLCVAAMALCAFLPPSPVKAH